MFPHNGDSSLEFGFGRQNVSSAGFPNPHLLGVCCPNLFFITSRHFFPKQQFNEQQETEATEWQVVEPLLEDGDIYQTG